MIKNKKGITLIALIITIIVLLVLAGIAIGALTSNNSVLKQATQAKDLTGTRQSEEQIGLAVISAITASGEKIEDIILRQELKKNIPTLTDENITGDEINGWKVKIDEKIYAISIDGTVEGRQIADRTGLVAGDYVDYRYDGQSTYNLPGSISGYAYGGSYYVDIESPSFIDETYIRASSMTWRILSINEDGSVDLIGTKNGITGYISLQGALGYNNAVYILNDIASKMYSNNKLGNRAIARCINIDDLEKQYIKDTDNKGIRLRNEYRYKAYSEIAEEDTPIYVGPIYGGNGATATSETTVQYTVKHYPTLYDKEKYSGIDSDIVKTTGLDQSKGRDMGTFAIANNGITATQTYYSIKLSDLIDSNNPVKALIPSQISWLASRYVNCNQHAIEFGVRFVGAGSVSGFGLFYSKTDSNAPNESRGLLPVITLDSSVKIIKDTTHDGSEAGDKACIIDD